MEENTQQTNHNMLMMKELSDIKTALALNTNETTNIKTRVEEIKTDGKAALDAIKFQNGRVTKQEEWSKEAQKIIESTAKMASDTLISYRTDKVKIWTAISVMLLLGGSIITLTVMAINSKIKEGISDALSQYEVELKQNE